MRFWRSSDKFLVAEVSMGKEQPNPGENEDEMAKETDNTISPVLLFSTMSQAISVNVQIKPRSSLEAAKRGLQCRSCQEEMSTKQALKLHTCYSIMDRTMTTEGNVNRKRVAPAVVEFGQVESSRKKAKSGVVECPMGSSIHRRMSKKSGMRLCSKREELIPPEVSPPSLKKQPSPVENYNETDHEEHSHHESSSSTLLLNSTSTMSEHITPTEVFRLEQEPCEEHVKKGLQCRSCQEEMSTKQALKLHTCYSIMDRTITTEGNVNRKRMVPAVVEFGQVVELSRKKAKCPIVIPSRRKSKKPNSIMLLKAQLVKSNIVPEAAVFQRAPRLDTELEHGESTLVVRWARRVVVEYPEPEYLIRNRGGIQLKVQECSVLLSRVSTCEKEEKVDISNTNKQLCGAEESVANILDDSSDSSSFEITVDEEPEVSRDGVTDVVCDIVHVEEACAIVEVKRMVLDVSSKAESLHQADNKIEDLLLKHIDETIEEVVKVTSSNYEDLKNSIACAIVSTNHHKKSETRISAATVRSMVMKARRRNNCMVRLKRLCTEEVKKWTSRKKREVDLWTDVCKTKIKSGSASKSRSNLKKVVNHFKEFNKDHLPKNGDIKKLESGFKIPKSGILQSRFAIPKADLKRKFEGTKIEDRTRDFVRTGGQVMSVGGFLAAERIETDAKIEQFLEDDGTEKVEFENMFDNANVLRTKVCKKVYHTEDKMELKDLEHKNWDKVKVLTTDVERKQLAKEQFRNIVSSDPAVNLSFHGLRRASVAAVPDRGVPVGCFSISRGSMKPLEGFRFRKKEDGNTQENDDSATIKKIKLEDFAKVMKSLFYKKYAKNLGVKKASQQEFDEFKSYLSHYKTGQEETMNFLSYYQEAVNLESSQTDEVMDMENQYSTFSSYYGPAETTFCSTCDKKHKFCQ